MNRTLTNSMIAVAALGSLAAVYGQPAAPNERNAAMKLLRKGETPQEKGPADYFTGSVRIDSRFGLDQAGRLGGALVRFEPGARTAWHTHPLGQTLYVVSGLGWAQVEGGPVEEIRPGDVVQFPPNVRHWHGASPGSAMSHLAFAEKTPEDQNVEWLEKVTDAQYRR